MHFHFRCSAARSSSFATTSQASASSRRQSQSEPTSETVERKAHRRLAFFPCFVTVSFFLYKQFYFSEIFSIIFYFSLRIGIGFSNSIKIFCFFRTRQIHRKWKSGPKQKTFPQISSTSFKFGKFENNLALIQIQQKQKTEFRSNLLKNVLCRNRFKKSRLEQFPSKTGFD